MDCHRNPDVKTFHYGVFITSYLVLVTVALSIFVIVVLYYFVEGKFISGILMFSFLSLVPIFLLRAALSRFPVFLDQNGISASIFGITTKRIKWSEVRKIRKTRAYNGYNYTDIFDIFDGPHWLLCSFFVNSCGNIVFTQDIHDLRDLLDRINLYAQRYEIPLVVLDPRAAAAEFAKDTAPGRWRRGRARKGEEKVAEF